MAMVPPNAYTNIEGRNISQRRNKSTNLPINITVNQLIIAETPQNQEDGELFHGNRK